jgi:hypothetical protein
MPLFPTNRLLFFTGLVFFPGTVLPVLFPAALVPACGVMGLFFVLVCLDALVSYRILSGVTVTGPEIMRLSRGHAGEWRLEVFLPPAVKRTLRMGFSFPPELATESRDRTVLDRKSTRLNSSHNSESRMPSSA